MQYDVEFNSGAFYPAAGTVELAEVAEAQGFGAVWKGESNSTDPMVLLSAMASRTRTLKLGIGAYHLFGRSPVTLGIQVAALNDLSQGRVLLGLGAANRNIAAWHGYGFERPLRRMREYIEIVRAVARGEKVEYGGDFYRIDQFKLAWRPSFRDVPVYIAGLGRQMVRLGGRLCDGIVINMANPAKAREIIATFRQGAKQAGRDPSTLEYVVKVRCCVHADREVAKRRLKQVLTFYNLADGYKELIAEMGFAEDVARVQEQYRAGGFKAALACVTDEMLQGVPMVAATSAREVRDRLEPYLEAGATRLVLPYVPCTDHLVAETRAFLLDWRW